MVNLECYYNYAGDNLIISNDFKYVGVTSIPLYKRILEDRIINYTEITIYELIDRELKLNSDNITCTLSGTEITIYELKDRELKLNSDNITCTLSGNAKIKDVINLKFDGRIPLFELKDYMEENYSNLEKSYSRDSYEDKIKRTKYFRIKYTKEYGKPSYEYELTLPGGSVYYDAGFKIICLKGLKHLEGI